ncbi:conserved hypothetical protein [Leishmania braziliensis MHOM/BR/75/M2904]|uniref:Uncharacterized protein n=2 Tax=Leishmania braziliensis TaxID=5660 RepID=A4HKZ8_LEIBR|nr:conserved hypothetical protein [Leishmania braziliensis MHOM/BR/75/M2904]CAJ2478952.1 unnamed protein product [Leishmania braziliensis]CAM43178.1 conserved hypothetical protein [Leishmania braziliensis MHOM/BR/75/M2904]SYZ68891.1 hypothetical_protein [Leishmania braziliensis MHOM/BR/75/M2904]
MLSFTHRVVGHRARQRLPRSLQGLPTPNVRRGWGNMKNLSNEEKRELLHGAWRDATPIRLVPDPSDRDSGTASEPITFATDEAADRYLAEEEEDEMAEVRESTLDLAQNFFVELATAADEEVDGAQMPPPPQSDEERRREMRDAQREFFGDFYTEQGIIDKSERYAFVDTMLRPSRPLFLVNSVLPLARLTMRDQLEAHSTVSTHLNRGTAKDGSTGFAGELHPLPVFTPTPFDPCLYSVPLPPTQAFGAPLHVRFSSSTSRWKPPMPHSDADAQAIGDGDASPAQALKEAPGALCDQAELLSSAASGNLIASADVLGAMMLDAAPYAEADSSHFAAAGQPVSLTNGTRESAAASDGVAAFSPAVADPAPSPPTQPPSLAHMYWLQRQVASSTMLNVDDVSVAVSLLSVRLAAAAVSAKEGASQPYEVVLCQANDRDETACTYHSEIAQYLFRALQAESSDPAAMDRLARVVIAVEETSFTRRTVTLGNQAKGNREGSRSQRRQAHLASFLCHESAVAVMDRYPNVVYLQPPLPNARGRSFTPPRGSLAEGRPAPRVSRPLSRVVVCVPATSQDGVRPRGWLAGGEEEAVDADADLAPFEVGTSLSSRRGASSFVSGAPPNTFVERCQRASVNFSKLQKQLYAAIRAVRADSGGWVIYATQSANVIENEAVVCAVLQRILKEGDGLSLSCESCRAEGEGAKDSAATARHARRAVSVECVPLDSPIMEACVACSEAASVLQLLCRQGRPGLSTWVAIEDGPVGQEAEQYSLELRTSVAQAAWRTDPMRTGSDGGFVVCLRVTPVPQSQEHQHGGGRSAAASVPPQSCCWWTHPDSHVVSAVTPATLQFVKDMERGYFARRGDASATAPRILHVGVPAGHVSTLSVAPAPDTNVVAAASALPVDCQISSAVCHVDVLAALRRSLPQLTLSAKALCELLLLKHVESRILRRQLRLHRRQLALQQRGQLNVEGSAIDVETETHGFLAAVEKAAENHLLSAPPSGKLSNRFYVWVGVAAESLLPSSRISSTPQTKESAESPPVAAGAALHPAVLAEVETAGVVAEVEYTHHSPSCDSASSVIDFTARLDVPSDMPERSKHLVALEEWRVALRDALLYVLRRTCKDSASVRLWADLFVDNADVSALKVGTGAANVRRSDKVLELAEEEYEAIDTAQTVPTRGAAHLPDLYDRSSLPGTEAGDRRADWLRDTNYLEWRRRRTQL